MDNVRILHGWTKDERKELEEAKDNGFLSVIALICSIKRDDDDCRALYEKYYCEDTNKNNQMARDIADYYCGNAKFPEQKYYVQLIRNNDGSYLNRSVLNGFFMTSSCQPDDTVQTEFTKQEIKDIDPRYMAFAVPVEEDDEWQRLNARRNKNRVGTIHTENN